MVSRLLILVPAVIGLTMAALGDALPSSGPYFVTPCNGASQPACMVNSILNPLPEPGITNALFQSWFSSLPGGSTGAYSWFVTDVNSSGVAIGQVADTGLLIDTAFIFDSGSLICCTLDDLFLNDINDNGFVVGTSPSHFPLNALLGYCCGGLNDGQNAISLTFMPPFYNGFPFTDFLGIDSSNRILAIGQTGTQLYELDPTPEPRTVVLFATALGLTAFLTRRRLRRV